MAYLGEAPSSLGWGQIVQGALLCSWLGWGGVGLGSGEWGVGGSCLVPSWAPSAPVS